MFALKDNEATLSSDTANYIPLAVTEVSWCPIQKWHDTKKCL